MKKSHLQEDLIKNPAQATHMRLEIHQQKKSRPYPYQDLFASTTLRNRVDFKVHHKTIHHPKRI
jgi:hypothetical protein